MAKAVAVLDRSESFGANPPLFSEVKNALFGKKPRLQSCVFGLGGRDLSEQGIEKVLRDLLAMKVSDKIKYVGLR